MIIMYLVDYGTYFVSMDVDAHDGRGELEVTKNSAEATRFPSMVEAWACWKEQSTVRPLRLDGKPNRPMTAYTVEMQTVQE